LNRRDTHSFKKKNIDNKYDFSKYIIWVVRVNGGKSNILQGKLKNAAPCKECCCSLRKLGFRKIVFSNDDGKMEMIDLRYYQNEHISHSQLVTSVYSRN